MSETKTTAGKTRTFRPTKQNERMLLRIPKGTSVSFYINKALQRQLVTDGFARKKDLE